MKVVYIAGPFRADNAWEIEQNVRRAEELSLEVWRLGFVALCPHTNTRFFQGAADDDVWLRGYLELVVRSDAVLVVQGWENSSGAQAEAKLAAVHNIPIFYTTEELVDWFRGKWASKA